MGLLDDLMGKVDEVAAKVGLQPDQVQALTATLQSKLGDGTEQIAAIEQTAREHGVPVDTIQSLLAHASSSQGIADGLGSFAKGLLNKN